MKNYNKILEAVNRGIQLALDDFDDEDQVQNVKSKHVQNRDYTKEYLDLLKYEVVDLGLPSGILWCRYNLGVDQNQLSKAKNWYGGYYAWGELKGNKTNKNGKIYFGWVNYEFGNKYNRLTKYCNNPEFGLNGFTDNLTQLLPEDDAAYQNKKLHNFKFHIPFKEQCEELIKYTNSYWVNNYNPNKLKHNPEDDGGIQGLNGRVFEGKNRNQLFIPSAGYHSGDDIKCTGDDGSLWTSNLCLDYNDLAHYLYFDMDNINIYDYNRCVGFPVRPVINL